MRELILQRIEEIRVQEKNFPHQVMRWKNFYFGEHVHISQLDFDSLNNEQLLRFFERIIRQMSKQM